MKVGSGNDRKLDGITSKKNLNEQTRISAANKNRNIFQKLKLFSCEKYLKYKFPIENNTRHMEDNMPKKVKSCLHHSIAFVLILAQLFALMPLHGITSLYVTDIQFKWFSLRTFYTLANMSGAVIFFIVNAIRYFKNGMEFGDLVTLVYFGGVFLTISLFLRMARRWYIFSLKWFAVEMALKKYEYQPNLSKRFKITSCIIMFFALGEHLLFISKLVALLFNCKLFKSDPLKTFFGIAFAPIFALTSFAYWKGFLIEYFNILSTFAWNFMDLFVILICAAMKEKFKQINRRVKGTQLQNEEFWKEIREDYNKITRLCKSLNDEICHLISWCLANDLFFICIQLFNTLKPLEGIVNYIYFTCSFGFLLARTVVVSLTAASVNDESKKILVALYNIPSEHFGSEADRLIQQINNCPVAMTASNYLEINRDLCLKIFGAIITTELILQQVGPMLLNTQHEGEDKPFCLQ